MCESGYFQHRIQLENQNNEMRIHNFIFKGIFFFRNILNVNGIFYESWKG